MHRYQRNLARQRAAKMAGVSNAWAVTFDREIEDDPTELDRLLGIHPIGDGTISDPIPVEDLSPLAAALLDDFEQWRFKVMGRTSRPWAVEAAHIVAGLVDSPHREFAVINVAPGTGKTTLFTLDIPAWLTCRSRTIRGVLGAIKAPLSTRYTRRLRVEFERELPLRAGSEAREQRGAVDAVATMSQLYGRFKPQKPSVWRAEGFIVDVEDMATRTEKEFTWLAASMEEDFIGDRVNFQSWDDAASRASTRSPEIRERHFAQWEIIEDRLEPNGTLLLPMQRLGIIDLSRYALDKRVTREIEGGVDEVEDLPKYTHIVYKAHYEDRCKNEHGRDAPAYPEGCLLDPSGVPWRDLQGKMSNRGEFLLVYQQDDTADPEATFKHIWIHGGVEEKTHIVFPGCWDPERDPGEIPVGVGDDTLSYASVDPSASGYWVVQWWLYDRHTQHRFLVDMHREKMGANDLLDMMPGSSEYRGIMEDWQARSVELGRRIRYWVLEHNSQQKWLSQYEWARQWYAQRGVKVISHTTYAPNKLDDKLGPEGSLPRLFEGGIIRLPGTPKGRLAMRPFVDELLHWGGGISTNDTVMAAWMAEFNLPTMLKQPDLDDWEAPVMWRPSWMRKEGEMRRSQRAMMMLGGYRDDDE